MTTNREKYIDNASNEELALTISRLKHNCKNCLALNECNKIQDEGKKTIAFMGDLCKIAITQWLSQEAEEETQKEDNNKTIFIPLPNDEIISKAIETLLLELHKMSARIDKLEKKIFNAISDEEYKRVCKRYGEDLMKDFYRLEEDMTEKDKTADEMFEELGYEKYEHDAYDEFDTTELYYTKQQNKKVRKRIEILKEMNCYKCSTIPENSGFEYIDEAEDKAIHKKISELKKGLKNER